MKTKEVFTLHRMFISDVCPEGRCAVTEIESDLDHPDKSAHSVFPKRERERHGQLKSRFHDRLIECLFSMIDERQTQSGTVCFD